MTPFAILFHKERRSPVRRQGYGGPREIALLEMTQT
jgi:hypothetical protein